MPVVAVVIPFLLAAGGLAHAQGAWDRVEVLIELSPTGQATVRGRSNSLRTVVEEICWRSGVELLAYDAPDRPFAGSYENLALPTLFERILAAESHIVAYAPYPGSTPDQVAWIKVLGDRYSTARQRRATQPSHQRPWQVPPLLLRAAFTAEHENERLQALASLRQRIVHSPKDRKGLLETEAAQIAEALARFPEAATILKALMSDPAGQNDEEIRAKITSILVELDR